MQISKVVVMPNFSRAPGATGCLGYSLLEIRVCRSRLYRRIRSDQTIGAECRQAFIDLLQNLIQWVNVNAKKPPINQILDMILR